MKGFELASPRLAGRLKFRTKKYLVPVTPGYLWQPAMLKTDEHSIAFGAANEQVRTREK